MEFWSPLVLLWIATALVVAFGVHFSIAAPLGFVVTLVWAASSLGGTRDGTSFVMVATFFAVPIAIGTAVAVAIGLGIRSVFGGK